MKKQLAAIILILCICLPACQIRLLENTGTSGNTGDTSQSAEIGTTAENTSEQIENTTTAQTEPDDGSKLIRDEEGLVTITVKDGRAEIEYDLEKWGAIYDMAEYLDYYAYLFDYLFDEGVMAELNGGPFPVDTYQGTIADACIGKIPMLSYDEEYFIPSVILLMEDGSLEYSPANLAMDNAFEQHYLNYPLYFLEDIVSLEYANGRNGETIYAIDKNGVKYDTAISDLMQNIVLSGIWEGWSAPLLENPPDGLDYYGHISFEDETGVRFDISIGERQPFASYKGNYRLVLAEDDESGYLAGSLIFNLTLDSNEGLNVLPDELICSYLSELPNPPESLRLWRNDGDYLFSLDGQYEEDYLFEITYDYEPIEEEIAVSWMVEPTLEYECIYYCPICEVFGPVDHDGDILDPKTGLVTRNKNIIKNGWEGHGTGSTTLMYDAAKKLYGWYSVYEGKEEYKMYTQSEYLRIFPSAATSLLPFREIDSGKVKEHIMDWGSEYDFDNAYQSGKFAFAYGLEFVTNFIYDYDTYRTNDPALEAAAELGGKWGVIGTYGEVLVPFEFEHILFIDENTAFAKYNGKYGIIIVALG